jgi:signal transduction histidine kinase
MNIVVLLKSYRGLNEDQNRVYRNFNIFLCFGLFDLIVVGSALRNIHPAWPFYMCIVEFFLLLLMLILHINGYFILSRYITFLLTTALQAMACVTHGQGSGFDYLFFLISVLPMMFFETRRHYISLFIISITAHLFVMYSYSHFKPLIIIDSDFPLYWNLFFTGAIIFGVMFVFKRDFQRSRGVLQNKTIQITQQKEEIESINNNLEQLVEQRTQKIREQEKLFVEFANINAHRVRSPLARILGLLNIIELESDKYRVTNEFLPLLKTNAAELKSILDEVGDTLNDKLSREE